MVIGACKLHSLWTSCVSNSLVYEAFARCNNSALVPQPSQSKRNLFLIAATHSIGNDIHLVAGSKEIDSSLCDANMALDAYDDGGNRSICTQGVECFLNFWDAAIY